MKQKYIIGKFIRQGSALAMIGAALCMPYAAGASNATTFSEQVNGGTLSTDIVDAGGTTVASPTVSFGAVTYNFDNSQNATGTLGAAAQKIRVANGRGGAAVAWTLTMAATGGISTLWTGGAGTLDFNNTGGTGQLTVDPSVGTITPTNSFTATGLTKGSSTAFNQGVVDSVTVLSASTGASQPGRWDFIGVSLSQTIPALTTPATYTIGMTLTVT